MITTETRQKIQTKKTPEISSTPKLKDDFHLIYLWDFETAAWSHEEQIERYVQLKLCEH